MDRMRGNRGGLLVGVLVAVAVIVLLAASFSVHVQDSFSTGTGPAGSAAYRQEIAFAECARAHGLHEVTDPPPGYGITVQESHAVDVCKRLAPNGREDTNVQLVL